MDILRKLGKMLDVQWASRKMMDSVGSQLPAGLTVESSEDRQKRLENERYVKEERGF